MDLITQLANSGMLGLLLAISLLAIIYLYRESKALYKANNDLQERRLADAVQSRDVTISSLQEIQKTLDKLLTLVEATMKKTQV